MSATAKVIRLDQIREKYRHRIMPDVRREFAALHHDEWDEPRLDTAGLQWPSPGRPLLSAVGMVVLALAGAALLNFMWWRK